MKVLTAVVLTATLLPFTAPLAQGTASEKNAQATLEKAGYRQVRDLKASPKGVAATATKDGKVVSVVVDSAGHIKEVSPPK